MTEDNLKHIQILKAYDEIPFDLGKTTLVEYIKGNPNPTILKRALDQYDTYGKLYKEDKRFIYALVGELIKEGYLIEKTIGNGYTVIGRTAKGVQEIFLRKFNFKNKEIQTTDVTTTHSLEICEITEDDKKIFKQFDFFLSKYNDEQKKTIISQSENILCIAGAGSGKTTVLTKRVEFLSKFLSIKQEKILAITFTKKAKEELVERLETLGIFNCDVETFNSFSEKILRKYGEEYLYKQEVNVVSFRDKIVLIREILKKEGINFEEIKRSYFSKKILLERSSDDLFFLFVNDLFSILDHYKNKKSMISEFYNNEKNASKKSIAKKIYQILINMEDELKKKGLRDFSDQILHTLKLFKKNPELIPEYTHVLIDEFQDINLPQLDLIKSLKSPNVFAVGDPRQAIYGWRGSKVEYILHFSKEFKNSEVIALNVNYRSDPNIVEFFNKVIEPMKLPNLNSGIKENTNNPNIFVLNSENEKLEQICVLESIRNSKTKRNEIFILARTHKVLEKYAELLNNSGIAYAIKSEEEYKNNSNNTPKENQVILATVHSIKGMEAKEVYVVSANSLSFPNKVIDNAVFALVKQDDKYDKYAEELRLFYVAMSRAKEKLVITYTGSLTSFITSEMLEKTHTNIKKKKDLFNSIKTPQTLKNTGAHSTIIHTKLREWRNTKATAVGIPTYMILTNAAIEQMAQSLPQSKAELFKISGLGPAKIAKYGSELIEIIAGRE